MSRSDRSRPTRRRFQIETAADWEPVAEATADFHDAVIREAALIGDEYLDADHMLRMAAEAGAILRLLVHVQQREVPAVELTFVGVQRFGYDAAEQVDPARCSQAKGDLLLFEVASVTVRARSCEVTLLDGASLGEHARLADLQRDEA